MCVRVRRSSSIVTRPWDPAERIVTIPDGLSNGWELVAVRAVLTELGAEQPPFGAICYCGAPVRLNRMPLQRVPSEMEQCRAS